MEIKHVESLKKWLALNDELQIGELNYTLADGILSIVETEVEPRYRGQKIAEDLVLAVADYAKDQGLKVRTVCTFAASVLEKNAAYHSLWVPAE